MAISVQLHISDDDEEDIYIDNIGCDNIPDWIRQKQAFGGVICDTYKGTTPFIPFDEIKSFWFNDEDFVDENPKQTDGIVH